MHATFCLGSLWSNYCSPFSLWLRINISKYCCNKWCVTCRLFSRLSIILLKNWILLQSYTFIIHKIVILPPQQKYSNTSHNLTGKNTPSISVGSYSPPKMPFLDNVFESVIPWCDPIRRPQNQWLWGRKPCYTHLRASIAGSQSWMKKRLSLQDSKKTTQHRPLNFMRSVFFFSLTNSPLRAGRFNSSSKRRARTLVSEWKYLVFSSGKVSYVEWLGPGRCRKICLVLLRWW